MKKYDALSIVSENREVHRAYYIPFSDKDDALKGFVENSKQYISG